MVGYDGDFFVATNASGVPVTAHCWWTTKLELYRIRRYSIRLSVRYLRRNVWRRGAGHLSRVHVQGLDWNNLTRNDEIYLRHSVEFWQERLQTWAVRVCCRRLGFDQMVATKICRAFLGYGPDLTQAFGQPVVEEWFE